MLISFSSHDEPETTALSAFTAFDTFFSCLGLRMKKKKKAEPPQCIQRLWESPLRLSPGVRLSPCPEPKAKLQTSQRCPPTPFHRRRLRSLLENGSFSAWHCSHALPLFSGESRSHRGQSAHASLNGGLSTYHCGAAPTLKLRWMSFHSPDQKATIYTDAFFAPGDSMKDTLSSFRHG